MESIYDYQKRKLKKYYGSSRKVYRQSDISTILDILYCLSDLEKWTTLTRLIPCNKEFLYKKAIPGYNNALERYQKRYPNIKEFFDYKKKDFSGHVTLD